MKPPLPPLPPRRVTRQDVARYAGVSTAVVSYVVNAGPKAVAPATRDRVLEAIRQLGYRPNATARALKRGSTEMLGLVVPDITNPYFAELARVIEELAAEKGYALLSANSAGGQAQERKIILNLISRQVDGLFLASNQAEPDLSAVTGANIPVVLLDRGESLEGVRSIGVDYVAGSREGVRHLIEHGHQRIALVRGADSAGTGADREIGWLQALEAAGLAEGPVMRVPFNREGGYEAGRRLLNRPDRPTAIFASSDMQAVGVLRALHEASVRIPEDIAVVSFDGSVESEYSWPPLTTVRQPIRQMAKSALDVLFAGTPEDGPKVPTEYFSYPTELIVRASCGCQSGTTSSTVSVPGH